jgi:putative ATP-binding cassette transporter
MTSGPAHIDYVDTNSISGHKRSDRGLLARFWRSARAYWCGPSAWRVWLLCALMLVIMVAQLVLQYSLNYWTREFFDSLAQRNADLLFRLTMLFLPLVAFGTTLEVISVWSRMTAQRQWRRNLTQHLLRQWLGRERYRVLNHLSEWDPARNPEYRIAEDARIATDAPIDLVLALLSSALMLVMFIGVLARLGGSIEIHIGGINFHVPAYLAISVLMYSGLVTAATLLIGRRFTTVVQDQIQAEAVFRASANLIRERGEGVVVQALQPGERRSLWLALYDVIEQWRKLCWQHVRITLVTRANSLTVPVIGLFLCVPKYLDGSMSLGEVAQAAAAFATVQGSLNWFVDNFQRLADWKTSANRVAILLLALDNASQSEVSSRSRRKEIPSS